MIRTLIGLPFRVGVRVTGAAVHGAAEVADRAFGLMGQISSVLSGSRQPDVHLDGSPPVASAPAAPPPPTPVARAPVAPAPAVAADTPPAVADVETTDHVSDEATLVDSVAEVGAEDGAGAQVNVAEPWDGYRQMKASDVIKRIKGVSTAVLAMVELYERSGRKRQTVLAAVERELKRANA